MWCEGISACRKEENMSRYSVILLDDEELILQSLQTLIDWEKLGCYIVGTAKTGDKGKRLIERLHPNIVITDIKMPGLTGLQLAEYCAKNEPQTKVVIVSAYADFNFAQSAMRAGTVNYLLKPIIRTELQGTIEKVVAELDKHESTRLNSEQAKAEMENTRTLATSSLLFNLARYGTSGSNFTDMEWIKEKTRADSVVVMGSFYNTKFKAPLVLAMAQTYTGRVLQEAGYEPIFGSADGKIILLCPVLPGIDKITARERLITVLKNFANQLPTELGTGIFCVSEIYNDEKKLQKAYEDTSAMVHTGYFCEKSCVIANPVSAKKDNRRMNTQELASAIQHGQAEEVRAMLNDWKQGLVISKDKPLALAKIRECSREAALCAAKLDMHTENLWQHYYENENFAARYDCLTRGVQAVCEYVKKKADVVGRMCLYVEEHYGDRDLSLEGVADMLQLNSSNLSRAFKKEMQENFSEYLARIRIEKAQALLASTAMKTYQIAEEVGFSDPHYFSQVFKKKCGIVPAEYREKCKKLPPETQN